MQHYSSTADMWSSWGIFSCMSFTAYYLDREWSFKVCRCLETFSLPANHTVNITEALTDIGQSWILMEKDKISITTDNGANILSAASILRWQILSCLATALI